MPDAKQPEGESPDSALEQHLRMTDAATPPDMKDPRFDDARELVLRVLHGEKIVPVDESSQPVELTAVNTDAMKLEDTQQESIAAGKVAACIRDLLSGSEIKDQTDRKLLEAAAAFILIPSNNHKDILWQSEAVTQVLAGYEMQDKQAPWQIDLLNAFLLVKLGRHHLAAFMAETKVQTPDPEKLRSHYAFALDYAKVIARLYKSDTLLGEVQKLQIEVD